MQQRPNIVFVICDDLAWGDLSCHGNPHVHTPHIDELHRAGRRYTGYRSGPLCTPARAEVMTGRCHPRTGAIDTYNGRSILRADEVTLARVLKDAGYATGLFGKWHLGDQPPSRPRDHGFEEVLVHGGGGIGQYGDHPGNTYFDPWLSHNDRIERFSGYCTEIFFDQATRWIQRQHGRPFFACIAPNCPHSPFQVPDAWAAPHRERGLNEIFARIYAMVENIDAGVGRIRGVLEQLGLTRQTLFVFTSDHGPCQSARHEGASRFNAHLRGIKGSLYEGGVRVPCLVGWPDQVAGGEDDARLAGPIDWMPTLARLAGAALPGDRVIDGVDLLAPERPDRTLVMQWHRGDRLRRDENYAVIRGAYKLIRPAADAADELYRLPDEWNNLIDEEPAIATALRQTYEAWFDAVGEAGRQPADEPAPIKLGGESHTPVALTRQDGRLYPGAGEGWGMEHPCRWRLKVVRPMTVQVRVSIDAAALPATLALRWGAWSITRQVPGGCIMEVFDAVEWPAGDDDFEAELEQGGRRYSVARIEITPMRVASASLAAARPRDFSSTRGG